MKFPNILKKKKSISHDTHLKEFLMTNFLIITVYEILSTPLMTYLTAKLGIFNQSTFIPFKNSLNFFFSTIPGADINALRVIFSLMFTGILIGFIYKLADLLYSAEKVKKYIHGGPRGELFTNEFGAKILLTFMITGVMILFLYPIFGVFMIVITIIGISNIEKDNNKHD